LFPDMIFEADFAGLADLPADGVMFTKEVEDPSALGIAVVEDGRIVELVEKPSEPISNLAVIGIYYVKQMPDLYGAIDDQMTRGIKTQNEYFIADAIQIMIDRGKTIVPKAVTVWEDCGNAEALLHTNRYLLEHDPPSPAQRHGSIIVPPSFVSRHATLDGAVVGPHASIGAGATVRHALVRDAIVEDGASIEEAVVEHSIVGRNAHVIGRPARLNIGDTSKVLL
jgi:glucose-1-phosphate thymidylyltransferase